MVDFPFSSLEGIVSLLNYGDHIDYEDDFRDGLVNSFLLDDGMRFQAIQIKKDFINNFCDVIPSEQIKSKKDFSEKIEECADMLYSDMGLYDDAEWEEVYDFDKEKYFPYVEDIKAAKDSFISAARKEEDVDSIELKNIQKYFDVACGYLILDNDLKQNNEIEALIKKYFGEEIWIPYDIEQRKAKFPQIFNPKNDIFKYLRLVGQQEGFYNVVE